MSTVFNITQNGMILVICNLISDGSLPTPRETPACPVAGKIGAVDNTHATAKRDAYVPTRTCVMVCAYNVAVGVHFPSSDKSPWDFIEQCRKKQKISFECRNFIIPPSLFIVFYAFFISDADIIAYLEKVNQTINERLDHGL